MQLKCRCPKCRSTQRWHIDEWPKLSEFVCGECGTHVAYSDGRVIKTYRPININPEFNFEILDDPITVTYGTISDCSISSNCGYRYTDGTITSTWQYEEI